MSLVFPTQHLWLLFLVKCFHWRKCPCLSPPWWTCQSRRSSSPSPGGGHWAQAKPVRSSLPWIEAEWIPATSLLRFAIPFSRVLPNPGIEPRSPALQADSLQSEPPGKPCFMVPTYPNPWDSLYPLRDWFCIFSPLLRTPQYPCHKTLFKLRKPDFCFCCLHPKNPNSAIQHQEETKIKTMKIISIDLFIINKLFEHPLSLWDLQQQAAQRRLMSSSRPHS